MSTPPDSELLEPVRRYYGERYRAHGDTARGMDWKDEASQRLRFEVLLRHMDLSGEPTLLDVGCGNGELLAFLRERGLAVQYRGIDVSSEMVAACQRRFGPDAAVLADTADLAPLGWTCDYAVASGTFNVKQQVDDAVWGRYLRRAVTEMYAACRVATLFNVMSPLVDWRAAHLYHLELGDIATLAAACGTRRILVDHTYPLYEMTVVLRRSDPP